MMRQLCVIKFLMIISVEKMRSNYEYIAVWHFRDADTKEFRASSIRKLAKELGISVGTARKLVYQTGKSFYKIAVERLPMHR
jgi:hypothetical protein